MDPFFLLNFQIFLVKKSKRCAKKKNSKNSPILDVHKMCQVGYLYFLNFD